MANAPDARERRKHGIQALIVTARLAELAIVILHDMLSRGPGWPAI